MLSILHKEKMRPVKLLAGRQLFLAQISLFLMLVFTAWAFISGDKLKCQVIAQTLNEKLKFTISSQPDTVVKPGEKLPINISFESPTPYELDVSIASPTFCGDQLLNAGGTIPSQSTTFELVIQIPSKIPDANCQITALQFSKRDHPSNVIVHANPPFVLPTPLKFKVSGLPIVQDSYPLPIGVVLNEDQRQFFRKKSLEFAGLRNQLLGTIDEHESPGLMLWKELLLTLRQGDKELTRIETEYRSEFRVIPENEQILFTDLHRRFSAQIQDVVALENNLRATKATPQSGNLAPIAWRPQELRPRNRNSQDAESPTKHLSGTHPPEVEATLYLFYWASATFNKIADRGKSTFRLSIQSIPEGAEVSEMRAGEPYKLIPHPTNIPEAEFPFADWTFKLVRQGCVQVRDFDPVSYSLDTLVVEFSCKSR